LHETIDKFPNKQHNGNKKIFPCNKWLDNECKYRKCEVTNIARKLKENPNNPVIANISGIKEKI